MDAQPELEQGRIGSEGFDPSEPVSAPIDVRSPAAEFPSEPHPAPALGARTPTLEEASFLVVESGKIRFFVRVRADIDVPTSLDDVQRFYFTIAPRNRGLVRRISVEGKTLPDARARGRHRARVDRVRSEAEIFSDSSFQRHEDRAHGAAKAKGVMELELASGTYAIATHRDHAHLLYDVEAERGAVSQSLVQHLRIMRHASYIAAMLHRPEAKAHAHERQPSDVVSAEPTLYETELFGPVTKRRFTSLESGLLDKEGTELVLMGGGQSQVDQRSTCARS